MRGDVSEIKGLKGEHLRVRYDPHQPFVIDGETMRAPHGRISALIGPNGSGKSTLLKALARQLPCELGNIVLDGRDIASYPSFELARKLGILFQERRAPADLTVEELLRHGRYPHRRLFESFQPEDDAAVESALRMAGIENLRHALLGQLSGGQKQLAWIAMAVAQSPHYLLLDEPTTFLDIAHQFDVMDLLVRLNRELGMTVVLVVHDLNLAARYADYIFALSAGKLVAAGAPEKVLNEDLLRSVFEVEARIVRDDVRGAPFCVPVKRAKAAKEPAQARSLEGETFSARGERLIRFSARTSSAG